VRPPIEPGQEGRSDAIAFEHIDHWREYARPLPLEIRALGLAIPHHPERPRTMQTQTGHDQSEWINAIGAAAILGITPNLVRMKGRKGELTVRKFARTRPLFYRPELEALAQKATRPAAVALA